MSDDTTSDDTAGDETAAAESIEPAVGDAPQVETTTPRTPSAAATAASRARRIGGRPMPTPRTDGTAESARAADTDVVAPAVRTTKPKAAATPTAGPAQRPRPPASADLLAIQRRLDRLRWIPAIVAGLAVVAMLIIGTWQSHGLWWGKKLGDTRTEQQQEVLASAKTCTAAVLSYDYRTLDKSQKAAEACITTEFKTQYEQTFDVVKQLAPQKKAVITFQVANGGVQSVSKDGNQWVVLLYGQSAYSDTTTKAGSPRLDVSSPVVTLTKVDGKWLVSNLNTTG